MTSTNKHVTLSWKALYNSWNAVVVDHHGSQKPIVDVAV